MPVGDMQKQVRQNEAAKQAAITKEERDNAPIRLEGDPALDGNRPQVIPQTPLPASTESEKRRQGRIKAAETYARRRHKRSRKEIDEYIIAHREEGSTKIGQALNISRFTISARMRALGL
jgi:hypothetical protein